MRASVVFAQIHGGTATGAVNSAHRAGNVIDLRPGQVAHKPFLNHERRKRTEAAMPVGAAVGGVAARPHHVKALREVQLAARAAQLGRDWQAVGIPVLVQQFEQLGHRSRGQLQVLGRVKPHALAGKTQVQLDGAAVQAIDAGQDMHFHGVATRRAGEVGGSKRKIGHSGVRLEPTIVSKAYACPCDTHFYFFWGTMYGGFAVDGDPGFGGHGCLLWI